MRRIGGFLVGLTTILVEFGVSHVAGRSTGRHQKVYKPVTKMYKSLDPCKICLISVYSYICRGKRRSEMKMGGISFSDSKALGMLWG